MKHALLTIVVAMLLLPLVSAFPQNKQQEGKHQNQHTLMIEMMKDSAMVNMMMERITSDSLMRRMMMQKMMHHAKTDSAGMMPLCKMVTDDEDMHATMTKMMHDQERDGDSTAREILIKFNPGIQQAQVSALESELGLRQIKTIPALDLRVFKITSLKSAAEVIAICEKKPFVKYAERNQQYKTLTPKGK